jgi:hypothetical protein
MKYIVSEEHRPFSYKDFLRFSVDGRDYKMAYGTFRNMIGKWIKDGKVELVYNSTIAFYTLKGYNFTKTITPNHTGVSYSNNPLYHLLLEHPLDKISIHNIRLLFKVKDIWHILSTNSQFKLNHFSKDITLGKWIINEDFFILVTIHRTDSATISIGCSSRPVALDLNGIIRFTSALAKIEERISGILLNVLKKDDYYNASSTFTILPSYDSWIVTMWHLNRDGLVEYTGEKFHIAWENAENIIIRAYSKQYKNKKYKIRVERQEYPNTSIFDAINKRLE